MSKMCACRRDGWLQVGVDEGSVPAVQKRGACSCRLQGLYSRQNAWGRRLAAGLMACYVGRARGAATGLQSGKWGRLMPGGDLVEPCRKGAGV